jgi:acyl-CoA dehydrogenase
MADTLLSETAERLFTDTITPQVLAAAERGVFPAAAWAALQDAGLHLALLPEDAGGFGMPPDEALTLLRVAGRHALPLPLAETLLASWLLAGAGLVTPEGPLAITCHADLALHRTPMGWQLQGSAPAIAWARDAASLAVLAQVDGQPHVALVPAGRWHSTPGHNIAREPRDTISLATTLPSDAVGPTRIAASELRAAGAATRSLLMAGALERITDMTVQYAQDRVQFGRPIGRFQAVQHSLAILASQTAAAVAAADMAAEAFSSMRTPAIAAAKARAGEAAGIGAGLAHQIHGALGFTYEHSLHFLTKRLQAWRGEYGGEAEWNAWLGHHLATAGADQLWAELTAI